MEWTVIEVKVIGPLALNVTFADGATGNVRFEETHLTGVFEVLHDPDVFQKVFIKHGAVAWPGELDLAPDAMHSEIKAHGEWVLR